MARTLAKQAAGLGVKATPDAAIGSLAGKPHFHLCSDRKCRLIYEDRCGTPRVNGRCQQCRGTSRANIAPRDPVACCETNSQQVVTGDDIKRYSLGGPGPWYQCSICKRSHGWPQPTKG